MEPGPLVMVILEPAVSVAEDRPPVVVLPISNWPLVKAVCPVPPLATATGVCSEITVPVTSIPVPPVTGELSARKTLLPSVQIRVLASLTARTE